MFARKDQEKEGRFARNFFYTLIATVLLAALLYITYRISNQVYKQNQIDKEISKLQEEIASLNHENNDLNELINYLQTDEFKEKEAKEKLNLIKEGEQLVLVKEKELSHEEVVSPGHPEAEVVLSHANYYWWWHYFFSLQE